MTSLTAFNKLVLATEAAARVLRISGLSFAMLKLLSWDDFFFSFFFDLWLADALGDERRVGGPLPAEMETECPSGGSFDVLVSWRILALATFAGCLRFGSCR